MKYHQLSHHQLERLVIERDREIKRIRKRQRLFKDIDFVKLVEKNERLERQLAEMQKHNQTLFIRLQQNRLYIGDIDIVDFWKSVEN